MGWNPIKDIKKAVSNVSNEFNNARETFERSDIGKVASVVARPVTTGIEVAKDVSKGDFDVAGKRTLGMIGQAANPWSMALDSSSTLKRTVGSDKFFGSYAKASDAWEKLRSGQSLSNEDVRHLTQANVKTAAIVGTVYAGGAYGADAALWVQQNPGTSAFIGSQLVGAAKSGNYEGAMQSIGNKLSPGLGDFIDSIVSPIPSYLGDDYLPSSDYATNSSSNIPKIALIGAGIILVLAIFKKMRSK